MKPLLSLLLGLLLAAAPLRAHAGFELHKADFYAVLGFQENKKVTAWMRCISSRMIDGYKGVELPEYGGLNFYDYLKAEFPGFKCKHRLLFHWGYNARPWNDALQAKAEALPWGKDPAELRRFQQTITREQQRRNREANALTEELFGFSPRGKEASWANAMISIVYDTHLIGDYTPDNRDLDGLQDFRSVVGDLINALRKLDESRSRDLARRIGRIGDSAGTASEIPQAAEELLRLLSAELPGFLKTAQDGSLARRFEQQGILFR